MVNCKKYLKFFYLSTYLLRNKLNVSNEGDNKIGYQTKGSLFGEQIKKKKKKKRGDGIV